MKFIGLMVLLFLGYRGLIIFMDYMDRHYPLDFTEEDDWW